MASTTGPGLATIVVNLIFRGIVQLITLPYHRFFTFNTLTPILELEAHAKRGLERGSPDREKLHSILVGWQARKKDELGFVSLAVRSSRIKHVCTG